MGFFQRLSGVINNFFQIGGPGAAGWNENPGPPVAIEGRDSTNSTFVIVRGATPVTANDLVTKNYADNNVSGAKFCIDFAITTTASQSSVSSIPANALVLDAYVTVTTGFSTGATIKVGQTGTTNLLMDTGDSTATVAGTYEAKQRTAWGASALPVLVTIAGAPSVGAGFVTIQYAIPLN